MSIESVGSKKAPEKKESIEAKPREKQEAPKAKDDAASVQIASQQENSSQGTSISDDRGSVAKPDSKKGDESSEGSSLNSVA